MRRKLFVILALATLAQARAVVTTDSIKSEVLGEWVRYNVYLPESYDDSGDTQYPILYLLHGLTNDYDAWNSNAQLGEVANELLSQGKICEMVIIMPNAGGPDVFKTWNGYFNMPGWSYHDFFFQELLPAVEKKYHVYGDKQHRAISGLSMGGGGSTVYCQQHPDMFSSCYAMSPWLDSSQGLEERAGGEPNKFYYVNKSVSDNSAIRFVEEADDETLAQLKSIKWFFDIGDDDFLLEQAERLHMLMRNKRIRAELRVRDGVHDWKYWKSALYQSLPFASDTFQEPLGTSDEIRPIMRP